MTTLNIVWIDGTKYLVDLDTIDGLQIRALSAMSAEAEVVLEGGSDEPDTLVGDTDSVKLTGRTARFYTRPPTMFGRD